MQIELLNLQESVYYLEKILTNNFKIEKIDLYQELSAFTLKLFLKNKLIKKEFVTANIILNNCNLKTYLDDAINRIHNAPRFTQFLKRV